MLRQLHRGEGASVGQVSEIEFLDLRGSKAGPNGWLLIATRGCCSPSLRGGRPQQAWSRMWPSLGPRCLSARRARAVDELPWQGMGTPGGERWCEYLE